MTTKPPMHLECSSHGKAPWSGAVFCPNCRSVYQTHDSDAPRYAPEICCGVRFMPPAKGGGSFSAMPICDGCAKLEGIIFMTPEQMIATVQGAAEKGNFRMAPTDVIDVYPEEVQIVCKAIEKLLGIKEIAYVSDLTIIDDFVPPGRDRVMFYVELTAELGVPLDSGERLPSVCQKIRARKAGGVS